MTDPVVWTDHVCLSFVPVKSSVSPENAAYINKRIPSQLANKTGSVFNRSYVHRAGLAYSCVISNSCSCQCLFPSQSLPPSISYPMSTEQPPPPRRLAALSRPLNSL